MHRARMAGLLAVAALAAGPGAARANGRFPATIDVLFKPGDHDVMSLQVTWGVLQTEDGGASWHWMCEDAVGFGEGGAYDPDYLYTPSGALWATTNGPLGVTFTTDHCTWNSAPAQLGGTIPAKFVSQIEIGPDGALYTTASTFDDSQLYRSTDNGASFVPISDPGGGADWWESLVVAPAALGNGQTRIYLTGYSFQQIPGGGPFLKKRFMYRSDDGGLNWTKLSTTVFRFDHGVLPDLQIMAVSPTDPDLVFARIKKANGLGIGDNIWRSDNAGASWTKVFESGDDVTALVIRQSGQVILGERLTGIHLSSDGGQTFGAALPDSPEVDCMRERDDQVLFLCGKSFAPESMALGTSTDAMTWTPILTFGQVEDAYPGCAAGTAQHDVCFANRWCCIADQFNIDDPCAAECDQFPPDAGPVTPDAGPGENPPKKTCCSTGTPEGALVLGIAVAVPLLLKRRRRNCCK